MSKSIKSNYILNLINTGSQFLFPLITLPYASRIMGPEGIGMVNFYQSILSYVILIAGLGIPMYGIKEVARLRDDKVKLSKTTIEILSIHLAFTVIAYISIALLTLFVPRINTNASLFALLSLSVLFTTIGCDWFYRGIEDFKYITIVGIVVKSLALIFLFVLVKQKDDILWYGFYCVAGTLGGNLFNFIRLFRFLSTKNVDIRIINIANHFYPIFKIFVFSIITSLYLNLNPVLLGFIKDDISVGYYASGLKLLTIATSISGSLGAVMLPRMSYLIGEGKKEEFHELIQKSYNYSIGVSLPLCVGLIFLSPYAVRILFGEAFVPSIICAQVMAPIVFSLSISSLMGTQILYPMGEIKKINIYCGIGALIDVILSIVLVPLFSQLGTSISYSVTEFIVMVLSVMAARKFIIVKYLNVSVVNYIKGTILMALILSLISRLDFSDVTMLLVLLLAGVAIYAGYLFKVKDQILMSALSYLKK